MIDLKYHIASIVAVFLALGLGVLIGSTIVGDDLLIEQQKKLLDRLEEQFTVIKDREAKLVLDNEYKDEIIGNYENYSQTLLPLLVKERLVDDNLAIVVTGNTDIPSGLINTLTIAGAEVHSKTVILPNLVLDNSDICAKLANYYNIAGVDDSCETLRSYIGGSVAAVLLNQGDQGIIDFLQENDLINFSGAYDTPLSGVIVLGGTNNLDTNFASTFDQNLIESLNNNGIKVFGVEKSKVEYSYIGHYQNYNITTIDNVDLSPGQISLVLAMEGEPGHYGIKATAQKFMPSLPVQSIGSDKR